MKRVLLLVAVSLTLLVTGCAVLDAPSRVNRLENRLDSIEARQGTIEGRLGIEKESVTYVSGEEERAGGPAVSMSKKEIQIALQKAGYYDGPIDGKFGKLTRKAIREFQADKNLKVDGIVGSQTKKALLYYLNE
ncbi:MAG: peptidoglycan-binding domain-containing protein [Candidatus Omnitrophota bacterium]|nr:peptidoglycan-binding domain-containing protein [Candidatus Omnitrophota bacterium]